jgi:hypothetical protein
MIEKTIEHEKKIYAPVVIPTCNRFRHLKNCVESLAACTYAEETELYISVDYPPDEKYVEGWKKVTEYVKSIQGFKKVNVWYQEINRDPFGNGDFLQEKAFEKYDVLIYTEDDNVFAPAFLDYMNKMLVRFQDDPRVYSIAGFSMCKKQYDSKIYKNYAFQPWGNGKWKKKREYLAGLDQVELYEHCAKRIFKIMKLHHDNKWLFCVYVKALIRENHDPYLGDAAMSLIFYLKGYYTIFPTKSLVRNEGFDGSGFSCVEGKIPGIDEIELDEAPLFEYDDKQKIPIYRDWYYPAPDWAKRSAKFKQDPLTYLLYVMMGKERYKAWRKRKGF